MQIDYAPVTLDCHEIDYTLVLLAIIWEKELQVLCRMFVNFKILKLGEKYVHNNNELKLKLKNNNETKCD